MFLTSAATRRRRVTGLSREIMGLGPLEAGHQVLARAGMTVDDIEINEAFAAQVLLSARDLGIDPSAIGSTCTAAQSPSGIPTA